MIKKNRILRLKTDIGGSKSPLTSPAPIDHLEQRIRFSFKNCNTNNYCIRNLGDKEIGKFYERLGHFEELSWRQIMQIDHKKGFSIEKRDTGNFKNFYNSYPNFSTFLHFRVNGLPNIFRVFGALKEDLCYVLAIDKNGVINH